VADLVGGRRIEVRHLTVSGAPGTAGFLPAGGGRPADEGWPAHLGAWVSEQSHAFDRVFVAGPAVAELAVQPSLVDAFAGTVLVVPSAGRGITLPESIEEAIQRKLLGIVGVG
jgi:hypothetical protein